MAQDNFELEKPLLSPIYYLKKVLSNTHINFVGSVSKILENKVSVIFLPSYNTISESEMLKLKDWVNKGGILIRFSDKSMIESRDIFLDGNKSFIYIRNMGKDLSIQNKISIQNFDKNSLFSSLTIPKDLEFTKQLILDNLNSEIKILASLQDQSPLISMKNVGKGKVILFHVTSNNEWSNLPLSSLFQDLISKLLLISRTEKDFSLKEMKIKYIITSSGELANPEKNYYLNYDQMKKFYLLRLNLLVFMKIIIYQLH